MVAKSWTRLSDFTSISISNIPSSNLFLISRISIPDTLQYHWDLQSIDPTTISLSLILSLISLFLSLSPWYRRRQWHPTPVFLPGKSHGWRSLVGCSPWGCEESDTTERLHFHFSLSCIGEGNGNPLQCSCLENPRDGGAWWLPSMGVTQSQTQLK